MPQQDFAQAVAAELPRLRRYARALTGNQTAGDRYAAAVLEAILADRSMAKGSDTGLALFRVFHAIWQSTGEPVHSDDMSPREAAAQSKLSRLTPNSREALLLASVEEMRPEEIAEVMQISVDEARDLVSIARDEMSQHVTGKIMVIEDETIIAMDLKGIATAMGHEVTGIARTHSAAVELANETPPDLVLADIQLADGSSGLDAVNELLVTMSDLPVIFITAFPERLLTGDRPEPAFLISKPYTEDQVRSAISQAMFFSSSALIED